MNNESAASPEMLATQREKLARLSKSNVVPGEATRSLPTVEELELRDARLTSVAAKLKGEFVGVDAQIDQVVKALRPWYLMPQALRRPIVVGLWGMTGVGKTSLVLRLVEQLGLMGAFTQEDLGKHVGGEYRSGYGACVVDACARLSGNPAILFFDDVHNARTISEMGAEIDRPNLQSLWTLIDSGLVPRNVEQTRGLLYALRRELHFSSEQHWTPQTILDDSYMDQVILSLDLPVQPDELRKVAEIDPQEFIRWAIQECDWFIRNARPYDFSKSLIFMAGNLDEAFADAWTVNPDTLSADELHERTRQVSTDKVKECLLRRFRPEQVARMGAIHLIFPSLNQASYERLIRNQLTSLARRVHTDFQVRIEFQESVIAMIAKEGIVPAQGARVVLSTITELIDTRLPGWLIEGVRAKATRMEVRFDAKTRVISVHADGEKEARASDAVDLREQKLPPSKMPDSLRQTLAVHEAGHAVVGITNLGRLPSKVVAGPSAWHHGGPRVVFPPYAMMTRELAEQELEIALAGYAAEMACFGAERLSTGAAADLQNATDLAAMLITRNAMGGHIGVSVPDPAWPTNLHSLREKDDALKEQWLQAAMSRCQETLRSQWPLFVAVANALLKSERLGPADLERLVLDHYSGSGAEKKQIIARDNPSAFEDHILKLA